jgi:hypothetical protein
LLSDSVPRGPNGFTEAKWKSAHNKRAGLNRDGDSILDVGWDVNVVRVFSVHVGLTLPSETILQSRLTEKQVWKEGEWFWFGFSLLSRERPADEINPSVYNLFSA